jgi:hypothetical protein
MPNPNQPTDRQMYFGDRLGLSVPAIVKLNKTKGRANVLAAMETVHGFYQGDEIVNVFGYIAAVAEFKAANV